MLLGKFLRVNTQLWINLDEIVSFGEDNGAWFVAMTNGARIELPELAADWFAEMAPKQLPDPNAS